MIRRPMNGLKYAPIVAAAAVVLAAMVAVTPPKGASAADTLVTPEGVTINVFVDTVTAEQVHGWLLEAGLEPHVKLTRVDVVNEGPRVLGLQRSYPGYCRQSDRESELLSRPRVRTRLGELLQVDVLGWGLR